MAKKAGKKMSAVQTEKETKPVRLEMNVEDYVRLDRAARRRGLSKAAYARMTILKELDQEDESH